jgi:putative DNA primase/helicase
VSGLAGAELYPVPQAAELMNLPEELRARHQWVLWKLKRRNERWDKQPFMPSGKAASHSDALTWSGFEEVVDALHAEGSGFRGIGFVFSSGDPYTGIDLDKCRDPETGRIEEWATQIISKLAGYAEVSPSGKGVHIVVRGKVPRPANTKRIEAYSVERFFTMTGRAL